MNPVASVPSSGSAPAASHLIEGPLTPTKTLLLTGPDSGPTAVAAKRAEIRRYFHQTCSIYERLFDLIKDDAAYYVRHEPLRHPLTLPSFTPTS